VADAFLKGQEEMFGDPPPPKPKRILGICYDGPLEPLRIKFDALPKKGALVLIETDTATPVFHDIGTCWRLKSGPVHYYEVTQIEEDSYGHVCVLLWKSL
jgi:hypothetical protein